MLIVWSVFIWSIWHCLFQSEEASDKMWTEIATILNIKEATN